MPGFLQTLFRVDAGLAAIPRASRVRIASLTGKGGTSQRWEAGSDGSKIVGQTFEPKGKSDGKSVVLMAGLHCSGKLFQTFRAVLHVQELVARGWRVVCFDAPGVGESEGENDLMGPATARALGYAVEKAAEGGNLVGVVAFGLGAAGAISAIARSPTWSGKVHFLFDMDGPTDRRTLGQVLSNKGLPIPDMDKDDYWEARDPFYNVDGIPCPYYRLQPNDAEGGLELVNAAITGKAGWARLNDNTPNQKWFNWRPEDNLRLSPAGFANRNRWLLGLLEQAFHTDYEADRKARPVT